MEMKVDRGFGGVGFKVDTKDIPLHDIQVVAKDLHAVVGPH